MPLRVKPRKLILPLLAVGLLAAVLHPWASLADASETELPHAAAETAEVDLLQLPGFLSPHYKVDPYIRAAIALQSVGKTKAIEALRQCALDARKQKRTFPVEPGDQLFVLCRMLFTEKDNKPFRGPWIGGIGIIVNAKLNSEDWPRLPIALVDGIPFNVVCTLTIAGAPESPEDYLQYCIQNCKWNTYRFRMPSPAQKKAAAEKLIAFSKTKTVSPVDPTIRPFLYRQIE